MRTRIPIPSLSISKSHVGNFTQGRAGAQFTVNVTNGGTASTSGLITVADAIPAGLGLVQMSGTGWTCASNSCSRSDVLGSGQSYPQVTVTVNVASNAMSPVVNQVTVSGGGSASASTTDAAIVTLSPSLTITKTHGADFTQGQTNAQYVVTVGNNGSSTTGTVTVTDNLPSGLTLVSMSGTGWNCSSNTCGRADVLATSTSPIHP